MCESAEEAGSAREQTETSAGEQPFTKRPSHEAQALGEALDGYLARLDEARLQTGTADLGLVVRGRLDQARRIREEFQDVVAHVLELLDYGDPVCLRAQAEGALRTAS